jgi:predicted permease
VDAATGRTLVAADLAPGTEPAAVVSDALWRNVLGEDPAFPGATISLSGTAFTVVGVMPRSFEREEKVWVSAIALPEGLRPAAYGAVARLRDGAAVTDAANEVAQLAAAQVAADTARYGGFGATARPLGEFGRAGGGPSLWILVGVAGAVVLVGLSNLTHLFLIRAQHRSAGLAVRASLGASTRQLTGVLLAEPVLVAGVGGALGLILAQGGKDLIVSLLPGIASAAEPTLGLRAVALAAGLALLVAAVVGLEPLRRVAGTDLRALLHRGPAGSLGTRSERRTRDILVAAQVAMSVVLLAGASILHVSWQRFRSLDLGYDADRVVQARPDWALAEAEPDEQWAVSRRAASRLVQRPEVDGVAVWRQIGQDWPPRREFAAVFDGAARALADMERLGANYEVEPGTMEALGVRLLRGRFIGPEDGPGSHPVAVVTEDGASAWWPGEDPLGHQVKLGQNGVWMTIVGVVESMESLGALGRTTAARTLARGITMPLLFSAARQELGLPPGWHADGDCYGCYGVMLGVRPSGGTADAGLALREEIADADPDLALLELGTFSEAQLSGYSRERILLPGRLAALGTTTALVLALIGVAGVVSEGIARRTREIGIRVALGAPITRVLGTAAGESLVTAGAGVTVGLSATVWLHSVLAQRIFDYNALYLGADTLRLPFVTAVALSIIALAGLTALLSARCALGIDPVEALRAD